MCYLCNAMLFKIHYIKNFWCPVHRSPWEFYGVPYDIAPQGVFFYPMAMLFACTPISKTGAKLSGLKRTRKSPATFNATTGDLQN